MMKKFKKLEQNKIWCGEFKDVVKGQVCNYIFEEIFGIKILKVFFCLGDFFGGDDFNGVDCDGELDG